MVLVTVTVTIGCAAAAASPYAICELATVGAAMAEDEAKAKRREEAIEILETYMVVMRECVYRKLEKKRGRRGKTLMI